MKNIVKIILNDFKHLSTNVVAIVIIMGLCILPSLYAWFNINSNWDPYSEDATSNLKIAVVSSDDGVELGENMTLCIGDSVISALQNNDTIGWEFPKDERKAINGVYDGTYYAALVIPEGFTGSIAGVMEGKLDGGEILYYENEKKNAIATKITGKAKTAVENQINSQVFSTITKILCQVGDALEGTEGTGSVLTQTSKWLDTLDEDITKYISMIDSVSESAKAASGSMEAFQSLAEKIVSDIQTDLSYFSVSPIALGGIQTVGIRIEDYKELVDQGDASLLKTREMLLELQEKVDDMKKALLGTTNSEEFQNIIFLLTNEPEKVGNYFSSLVNLETEKVYDTKNYGSAMSPFYTILAIWVGALILVAIIHARVKKFPGIQNMKPWEEFFGRYFLFFIIGQAQTLICVLGDILFLEIHCPHPFYFWLASALSSFVFTIFIYSLTFAFGNIGEALAVIVMVLQVAGAGGTFPIEVLPDVYQQLYRFMPFPYCMNALKECVGGMYQNDYWIYMGKLFIFIAVSIFIGLVLRIPFIRLNKMIEKSKERSDLME